MAGHDDGASPSCRTPLRVVPQRKADIAPVEPKLAVEIPQQLRLHIPPLLKKVVLDDSTQVGRAGWVLDRVVFAGAWQQWYGTVSCISSPALSNA